MFTGLVEAQGRLRAREARPGGLRFTIAAPGLAEELNIGESVAVMGCCLTVIERAAGEFVVEAGEETLSRTNLGLVTVGCGLNLERALRPTDRLGGHFVTGHIDCVGTLVSRIDRDDWCDAIFTIPSPWDMQVVSKGSIAVDGVSLTVVEAGSERFSVALIPHTLQVTTLGGLRSQDLVNLETDLLAKYVQRAGGIAR